MKAKLKTLQDCDCFTHWTLYQFVEKGSAIPAIPVCEKPWNEGARMPMADGSVLCWMCGHVKACHRKLRLVK
jgi:hypothetical protein